MVSSFFDVFSFLGDGSVRNWLEGLLGDLLPAVQQAVNQIIAILIGL